MKKEMTIHAALSYLKTADKRIQKALNTDAYIAYAKVGADKINGVSAKDAKDEMKSSYQSVVDIINTVNAIKKAISKSNAENTVVVCGNEMTVAEAIYMMQYGIDVKKSLLNNLRSQYASAKTSAERFNRDVEQRADKFIESMYGSKEKATGQDAIAARDAYIKQNTYEVVDPIGLMDEIKSLEAWINEFETEVDGAIQVSNATHTITIEI